MGSGWEALNRQVIELMQRGQFQEALAPALAALAAARREKKEKSPDLAVALNNLGELYQVLGDVAGAESAFLESIEIYEKVFGRNHLDVAEARYKLGTQLASSGKYHEAEAMLLTSRKILEKSPEAHPMHLATVLETLSNVYEKMGQNQDAKEYAARAYKIRKPEHMQKPRDN